MIVILANTEYESNSVIFGGLILLAILGILYWAGRKKKP
jgi:LPXTG-motif cell wall-anchored protein